MTARSAPCAGLFIHGAEKTMVSSTSGINPATAEPAGDVSSVMRQPSVSRNARIAGVLISTSPRLSSRTHRRLRTSRHIAVPQDQCRRVIEIGRYAVGLALRAHAPFRLVAVVDEHRAAAGAPSRLDIVEDVAHHPRALEAHAVAPRGALQKAAAGLAALAAVARGMRTVIEAVQVRHHLAQPPLHAAKLRLLEQPERDTGLVGNDDQPVAARGERGEALFGTRREADALGIDVVRHVFHQRPVLVEKDSARAAGHHAVASMARDSWYVRARGNEPSST